MLIVLDAFQASSQVTGTDRLAFNMLRELQKLDSTNEYIVLVNPQHDFISTAVSRDNFRLYPIRARKRAVWLTFSLPVLLVRFRADAFYSFHNLSAPGFGVCRTYVSVLDFIPLASPSVYFGNSNRSFRRLIVTTLMRNSLRVADGFTVISEFTRALAVAKYSIDPNRTYLMHLQADPRFGEYVRDEELVSTRSRYQLPTTFVLAIGGSEPRKNVMSLVSAHKMLPSDLRAEFPLVVAGGQWHGQSLPLDGDEFVFSLGFVDDIDLPRIYRLATVFAFPSTYEGFGLPVLEAMSSGTPVICSNTTSLPEVVGDAALTFDPEDVGEISGVLCKLLEDPKLRSELSQLGFERVKLFSWERSAASLLRLLTGT